MNEKYNQYKIEHDVYWQNASMYGSGYDVIARARGWKAIPSWGRDGYDLGSWPLIIVFAKNEGDTFDLVEYCEGDVSMWRCPSLVIRNAIIDEIAFFHWQMEDAEWIEGYKTVDDLPEELKGPCRHR